jgi:hypothetical protein
MPQAPTRLTGWAPVAHISVRTGTAAGVLDRDPFGGREGVRGGLCVQPADAGRPAPAPDPTATGSRARSPMWGVERQRGAELACSASSRHLRRWQLCSGVNKSGLSRRHVRWYPARAGPPWTSWVSTTTSLQRGPFFHAHPATGTCVREITRTRATRTPLDWSPRSHMARLWPPPVAASTSAVSTAPHWHRQNGRRPGRGLNWPSPRPDSGTRRRYEVEDFL